MVVAYPPPPPAKEKKKVVWSRSSLLLLVYHLFKVLRCASFIVNHRILHINYEFQESCQVRQVLNSKCNMPEKTVLKGFFSSAQYLI